MAQEIRLRFAPSPTGGLHLGGVRTVLFNYLFARQHGGKFILRIEDTDETRFVAGAEEYIYECLAWCGLQPDEGVVQGGPYGPYKQSERKEIYAQYAHELVKKGAAYYAFDTDEELQQMREALAAEGQSSPQYDHSNRLRRRNSLSLPAAEVEALLASGAPCVVRARMEAGETIVLTDLIRGEVRFDAGLSDDKVLLKRSGMPTYHLAVVVDDYLMKISHAFRGEEWLPSAPIHIHCWKHLFGLEAMPQWAHLPLILKPDGHGKLSKRDGDALGFPVFAMDWKNADGVVNSGFRERGFLPEAFLNVLAVLGWSSGTEQELFSMDELIQQFAIERVHKGGAKFNWEKALWYNHQWIQHLPVQHYLPQVKEAFATKGIVITDEPLLAKVMELVKDRCHLLPDFVEHGHFFFQHPETVDTTAIAGKWDAGQAQFFSELIRTFQTTILWESAELERAFKEIAAAHQAKPGGLMLPFRIMLVGGKFGPAVFAIAELLGKEETVERMKRVMGMMAI